MVVAQVPSIPLHCDDMEYSLKNISFHIGHMISRMSRDKSHDYPDKWCAAIMHIYKGVSIDRKI